MVYGEGPLVNVVGGNVLVSTSPTHTRQRHGLAALAAFAFSVLGCTGEIVQLGTSGTTNGNERSGGGGGGGSASDEPPLRAPEPEVGMNAAAARFRCDDEEARGTGTGAMRRLTREEYLQAAEYVFGASLMAAPAVEQAAAQIPGETTGDITKEFQNGHALDHVQGILLTAEAVAAAVVADRATLERVVGTCASKADATCAGNFLDAGARRIVRRALDPERRQALLSAFSGAGGGTQGVQALLARLLQAPEAVFHLELPRQRCVTTGAPAQTASFAWNDRVAFFSPAPSADKLAPPEVINTRGWYVWDIPASQVAASYTRLTLELNVSAPSGGTILLNINLDDKALQQNVTLTAGAQQINIDVALPQRDAIKLGVDVTNASADRTLTMRSLKLATTASEVSDCTPEAASGGKMTLDDWSVASRLAFALTGRGPDEELLKAAARGELRSEAQVRPHAARLIRSPDARRQLEAVLDSWLHLNLLPTPTDTIANAAGIDPAGLGAEARRELLDYATYLVLDRDADAESLMTARIGFPRSDRMAKLYGSAIATDDKPVDLPNGHGGLLLRVAPLLSGQHRSSPIMRGVYVRKSLMCDELPSPDFSVVQARTQALEEADPAKMSAREITTALTSPPTCMGCHVNINPIGFTLEQFGPLGLPRKVEVAYTLDGQEVGQHPIDATTTAAQLEIGGPDRLDGAEDLMEALANGGKVRACIAERFYTHAQMRPAVDADSCALAEVEQGLRDGMSIKEAWLLAVVNAELFLRKDPGAAP
jgi:Protein of unknown function (DUF1592)/Protein of unknown function (DUF1588)/Protein of unknown function (DUF1585)